MITVLFCTQVIRAQNLPSYVPSDSLKGWWPFTGNAIDSSRIGNDGTVNGASLSSDRFGLANHAYSYGGSSNSITFPNLVFPFHRSTDASISLWVYLGSLTNSRNQATLVKSSLSTVNDYNRYNLYYRAGTGLVLDYRSSSSNMGSNLHTLNIKTSFPSYTWLHIVYTRQGNVYKLYYNGKLFNTFTDNSPSLPNSVGMILGDDPIGDLDFAGKLDDVGLWSRALSDCEVYHLYKSSLAGDAINLSGNTVFACRTDSLRISAMSGFKSYQWSNGQTSQNVYIHNAQTLSLIATDSANCTSYDTITAYMSHPIAKIIRTDSVTCFGARNGAIFSSGTNGKMPYTYRWNNGAQTSQVGSLDTGKYTLVLTDSFGCRDTVSSRVYQPQKLLIQSLRQDSVTCFGYSDGAYKVACSGGISPYTKLWSTGDTTDSISNRTAGAFTFFLRDAHACKDSLKVQVSQPDPLQAKIIRSDSVTCFGGSDGQLSSTVLGGTGPYTYQWDDSQQQKSAVAGGLKSGTYNLKVKDRHQCSDTVMGQVKEPTKLTAKIVKIDSVSCYGLQNGGLLGAASGGIIPYTYSWNTAPAQNSAQATHLGKGRYLLTVSDYKGCKDTVSAFVPENNLPIPVHIVSKKYVLQGEVVQLKTDLNEPEISYNWSPVSSFGSQSTFEQPHLRVDNTMQVAVEIQNKAGCKGTDTTTLVVILPLTKWLPTAFTPNDDHLNEYFGLPDFFEIVQFDIFNRWGEKLFSGSAEHPYWDGKYQGEYVEEGMYLYQIKTRLKGDASIFDVSGMVLLLR